MASKKRPRSIDDPAEGFPEEIFLNISDEEKQDYQCNICLQIVRDPVFCENVHLFCRSCLNRWKTTTASSSSSIGIMDLSEEPTRGSDCPVCRVTGTYTEDTELKKLIEESEVACIEDGCKWTGDLASYDEHVAKKHKVKEPSARRLRSSDSSTERVTYHY